MIEKAKVETGAFNGVRVVVHTSRAYDDVLAKLRSLMGVEIVALAKKPITEAEFMREVEERFVGESGFMLFAEIDESGERLTPSHAVKKSTRGASRQPISRA
jgi:hypothetical protein